MPTLDLVLTFDYEPLTPAFFNGLSSPVEEPV